MQVDLFHKYFIHTLNTGAHRSLIGLRSLTACAKNSYGYSNDTLPTIFFTTVKGQSGIPFFKIEKIIIW